MPTLFQVFGNPCYHCNVLCWLVEGIFVGENSLR